MKINTNPDLKAVSIDEKIALVKCAKCGYIGKMKRTDIYYVNRHNIYVPCQKCAAELDTIAERDQK